ncbi:MAG: ComEC/Rec2 family competence protein, partial [Rhodothermales bacterium]|nr:ComEC/Rec2 family competence protein [Rhodothermales bacterium]
MRRLPALPILCFFASGIATADLWPGIRTVVLPLLVIALSAVVIVWIVGHVHASAYGPTRLVAAAVLLVLCGITSYSRHVFLGDDSWKDTIESEQPVEFVGRVKRVARVASGKRLEIQRIVRLPDGTVLPGRIHVYVDSTVGLELASGTIVSVLGRVRELPPKRNPSDFNYGRYLRRRGFKAVMFVEGPPVALSQP